MESYCLKILQSLKEPQFESTAKKVLDVFDKIEQLWVKKKSRFGIKDNKEFTDLLLATIRDVFIQNKTLYDNEGTDITYQGEILRVIQKEPPVWYGFIKRGDDYENVYFDSRSYKGKLDELVPHPKGDV